MIATQDKPAAVALEVVNNWLHVNGVPVEEVVHLQAAPFVVLVTEAGAVLVVPVEAYEATFAGDPLAG